MGKKKQKKRHKANVTSDLRSNDRVSKKIDKKVTTISACIIVKNEEKFLPQCLNSIKGFVDEIIVVDTGSTDKTVDIAGSHGARIYHHPWEISNSFNVIRQKMQVFYYHNLKIYNWHGYRVPVLWIEDQPGFEKDNILVFPDGVKTALSFQNAEAEAQSLNEFYNGLCN
jgi:cellulose synthase/poly-beta-1,6-N-acetylglucosamine synthase-like glycosyltransferase